MIEESISRLTVWAREFGDDHAQAFVDDVLTVVNELRRLRGSKSPPAKLFWSPGGLEAYQRLGTSQ